MFSSVTLKVTYSVPFWSWLVTASTDCILMGWVGRYEKEPFVTLEELEWMVTVVVVVDVVVDKLDVVELVVEDLVLGEDWNAKGM